MIPLKLHIKNFVSYGNTTQIIDFEPYHLICFSGKNGHGKSALLDALTWAIWGQARKALGNSKADEGLVRLGQTNMFVGLDFICNGQTYKIRREFTLIGAKSQTNLEFGMVDPETGQTKPLTDKTIRTTQEKIDSLIGLSFEAFINSAFLRQGHSNEFSKKSPKDRKELLANILGLDTFESLRKRAADKVKESMHKRDQLSLMHNKILHHLAQKSVISFNLSTIVQQLTILESEEITTKEKIASLIEQKRLYVEKKNNCDIIAFKLEQINQQLEEKLTSFRQAVANYRAILKQENIALNTQLLQKERISLQELIALLEHKIATFLSSKERSLLLQEQLVLYTSNLQQKHTVAIEELNKHEHIHELSLRNFATKLDELQNEEKLKMLEQTKLEEQLQASSRALAQFAAKNQELPIIQEQFERRKAAYHKWIAQANALSSELKALEQKHQFTASSHNPQCPLCYQDLSSEKKQILLHDFNTQKQNFHRQLARYTKGIAELKELLVQQHARIESCTVEQNKHMQAAERAKYLEESKHKNTEVINKIQGELKIVHEALTKERTLAQETIQKKQILVQEYAQTLASDPFISATQSELAELQNAMHDSDITYGLHADAKKKMATLEHELSALEQFKGQIAFKHEHKKSISILATSLKLLKKQRLALTISLQAEQACLPAQNDSECAQQENQLKQTIDRLYNQKMERIHQKISFEQQLLAIERQEQEYEQQKLIIKELSDDIEDYQAIASALSKDGIQALLIEDAIPEIEQEANRILSKLTDNQSHIIIDSLRDLKNGGTKETLDIKISDSIGIRPYELFSGGEAFRIDFALRISISKMLARRAGTALQTLIIDEGFGSQDDEGLSNIMDALHKIQEDFAKVIIVSHLPSMKDQFPVHFLINKGAHGSTVRIVENG